MEHWEPVQSVAQVATSWQEKEYIVRDALGMAVNLQYPWEQFFRW